MVAARSCIALADALRFDELLDVRRDEPNELAKFYVGNRAGLDPVIDRPLRNSQPIGSLALVPKSDVRSCLCRHYTTCTMSIAHFRLDIIMKAKELAERCKIGRSWLNELTRRGEVPGARLTLTGRWIYPGETGDLRRFIKETRRRSDTVRRQQLNVTADVCEKRLRDQQKKISALRAASARFPAATTTSPVTRAERRLEKLKAEFASDYLASRDVAVKAGCSQRRVTRLALTIPGCERMGGHFVFKKSDELLDWIRLDVTTRNRAAKRRAVRYWRRIPHTPNLSLLFSLQLVRFRFYLHKYEKQLSQMSEHSKAQLDSEMCILLEAVNNLRSLTSSAKYSPLFMG